MLSVQNPFGEKFSPLYLPNNTYIAHMKTPKVIENVQSVLSSALEHPINSKSLLEIALEKKRSDKNATCTIVVSDNTRPVPYKGDEGILLPIIKVLLAAGYSAEEITLLIATGMHRAMQEDEIHQMLDEEIFKLGIKVVNHNCKDEEKLEYVGTTKRGTKAMIDTHYTKASLKIATGLVESHFMAGASGGRKAICPGIIGEESTFVFHGPELMAHPNSRDLNLIGNPVHEESLEVAHLAGVDFLVNVTLDHAFHVTGIFAGELEKAHYAAVDNIKSVVQVEVPQEADIVITHGGFVGMNHYQCAKCGVASLGALKKDGYLIAIANITDKGDAIGSINYKTTLALLHLMGPDKFVKLLNSPDWQFLPEQWQVQQWAKVFKKTEEKNFYFYAPQIEHKNFTGLPGVDVRTLFEEKVEEMSSDIFSVAIEKAISDIERRTGKKREELSICYLAEGPYEIPVVKGDK